MIDHLENALRTHLEPILAPPTPQHLRLALEAAVLRGGGRVRPRLALAVASSLGQGDEPLALAAACAIELMHSAALIQDDLPCFDNAATRRGQPCVHRLFGEATTVLAADALIIRSFETILEAPSRTGGLLVRLTRELARAGGAPRGLCAGQAAESDPKVDVMVYHQGKTSSLFEAAAVMGAMSVGWPGEPWRAVGRALGAAYQIADDLADRFGNAQALGKPTGQDVRLHRPNAATDKLEALAALKKALQQACNAVPVPRAQPHMRSVIYALGSRLVPDSLRPMVTPNPEADAPSRCAS